MLSRSRLPDGALISRENQDASIQDFQNALTLPLAPAGLGTSSDPALVDSIRQVIGEVDDEYNLEEDDVLTSFTYTAAPSDPADRWRGWNTEHHTFIHGARR